MRCTHAHACLDGFGLLPYIGNLMHISIVCITTVTVVMFCYIVCKLQVKRSDDDNDIDIAIERRQ